MTQSALLDSIQSPDDLKSLNVNQLMGLSKELREYLIAELNECGGHFGANLGVVELTVALHATFDTPKVPIIWDVGHQAYAHKVLTGRKAQLSSIRQTGGLAPFPTPQESPYDAFTVGHAGNSIGAALGMSLANSSSPTSDAPIAVIGDGAMTCGMAFEALNHAGDAQANLLIILNDNKMSISPNVGALSKTLSQVAATSFYQQLKSGGKRLLAHLPEPISELAHLTHDQLKRIQPSAALFQAFGINYFGPIDGHNLPELLSMLSHLKAMPGPKLLHIKTVKGKGLAVAEADPVKYHAVKKGYQTPREDSAKTALPVKPSAFNHQCHSYSQIFGFWMQATANDCDRAFAITPAMREGSGLVEYQQQYPNRYADVGIAEQHSVTLAGGLASAGMKPVVAIYSSFLQRGFDQLIHDVSIDHLDVLFAIDRASVVGDGPTHHGIFDISYLRMVPKMVVMTPSDGNELWRCLNAGYHHKGQAAVRYGRLSSPTPLEEQSVNQPIQIGESRQLREGQTTAILFFGPFIETAMKLGQILDATVIDMRFVKPLDHAALKQLLNHRYVVTLEEHVLAGGAGSAVNEWFMAHDFAGKVLNCAFPDVFPEHGDRNDLLQAARLDYDGILSQISGRFPELMAHYQVSDTVTATSLAAD